MKRPFLIIFLLGFHFLSIGQNAAIDYENIYRYGLDADLPKAMEIVNSYDSTALNTRDKTFLADFKKRFAYSTDESDYLNKHTSSIDSLLSIYQQYWHKSLLEPDKNQDSLLVHNLVHFLSAETLKLTEDSPKDSIDNALKKYIKGKGYFTTGFGRVGKLYDLLVWKTEQDTLYKIENKVIDISVPVIFMRDFVTSGWEEYATFGKYYPAGWATTDKLYCVKHKYDLESEKFRVSFLSHEGQHFKDYKLFDDSLSSYELEYRAKLVEIALSEDGLYSTLKFFINNSNESSHNGHSKANYYVVKHLSQKVFGADFVKDIDTWKQVRKKKIKKTALKILRENTKSLQQKENNISSRPKN